MKYKLIHIEKVAVISLSDNSIISNETEDVLAEIKKQIDLGVIDFIIDLKKVKYLDSSGINFLIAALTVIRNAGGELVLASLSDKIDNLLIITKLNSIFNVYKEVDESIYFLNNISGVESNQS